MKSCKRRESHWKTKAKQYFSWINLEIDLKTTTAIRIMKPQETMGPAVKDRAVRELKKVGKDLQDIHLQVKQQQKENQGSEEWIQVGFFLS